MDSDRPYIPPMQPLLNCAAEDIADENLKALLASCAKVIYYYTVRYDERDYLEKGALRELAFVLRKIYETYRGLEEVLQEHSTDMDFYCSMSAIERLLRE